MNKTFTLTIHCDTPAFHPENMPEELATQIEIMGILNGVRQVVSFGATRGSCFDTHGEKAGEWEQTVYQTRPQSLFPYHMGFLLSHLRHRARHRRSCSLRTENGKRDQPDEKIPHPFYQPWRRLLPCRKRIHPNLL